MRTMAQFCGEATQMKITDPYPIENGEMRLPAGAGWGTTVNEEMARAHRAKKAE
jgi:L-alanine-DL-glutamate epimerase-like enolase superfamily enzyme